MLAKSGLLARREKLPVVCLAFVLLKRGFKSADGMLRLEARGRPAQQIWFEEVCLWKTRPESWWDGEPGLMALYPLCQHDKQPREAIERATRAIEEKVPEAGQRSDTLTLLNIFGELAYPKLNIEAIIGSEKMRESKLFQRVRGETRRADVCTFLQERFGSDKVADVLEAVGLIEDTNLLEDLVRQAARCKTVDEFRAALPKQKAKR